MANDALRVGVIGVGFGTAVHVPAFRAEGWEISAICSRTLENVQKAAQELEIPNVFTDYRDLIASNQVDVVAVVTPPISHAEPTLAAIAAGKHVLCEKPFAMNIDEAKAMRDAAKARGVTAMVAHEFRYTPQRLQAKRLMEEGYVGEVHSVYAQANFALGRAGAALAAMTWQAGQSEGGGALGALGSHFIDSFRWWVGEVAEVSGSLAMLKPERADANGNIVMADGDDTFVINLKFKNGALGSFAYTAASPVHLGARIVIEGSEGVLVLPQAGVNPSSAEVVHGAKVDEEVQPLPRPVEFEPFPDATDRRIPAFRRLVRDFQTSVAQGISLTPNFDDGVHTQAVLDAIRESSATGKAIAMS